MCGVGFRLLAESLAEGRLECLILGVLALGVGALAGLIVFRRGKTVPAWFGSLIVAAALIVSGLMAWTANLGGQVRHSEIRGGPGASVSGTE